MGLTNLKLIIYSGFLQSLNLKNYVNRLYDLNVTHRSKIKINKN